PSAVTSRSNGRNFIDFRASAIPWTPFVYSLLRSHGRCTEGGSAGLESGRAACRGLIRCRRDAKVRAMLILDWNQFLRVGCILGALAGLASCSGTGVNTRRDFAEGDPNSTGSSGTLDTTGGMINTTGPGGSTGEGMGCQQLTVKFVPQIPTVFILVD